MTDMPMDESDRISIIKAISLEVAGAVDRATIHIDKRVDAIQTSNANLANQVAAFAEESKRTRTIAEEAKRMAESTRHEVSAVYEAVKAHNKSLESRVAGFEKTLTDVSNENRVQTETLAELAASASERTTKHAETQQMITRLQEGVTSIASANAEREKREAVAEALKKSEESRIDTFWKRLPVLIAIGVTLAGVLVWLFNTLLTQNRIINNIPIRGPMPAVSGEKP